MSDRTFHIGDLLSVITGRLLSPRHMAGVQELLDYTTGDSIFTHQIPRACEECAPELRQQHPDLAAVDVPESVVGEERVQRWITEQVARFGEYRVVRPLAPGEHTNIHPLIELASLMKRPRETP